MERRETAKDTPKTILKSFIIRFKKTIYYLKVKWFWCRILVHGFFGDSQWKYPTSHGMKDKSACSGVPCALVKREHFSFRMLEIEKKKKMQIPSHGSVAVKVKRVNKRMELWSCAQTHTSKWNCSGYCSWYTMWIRQKTEEKQKEKLKNNNERIAK